MPLRPLRAREIVRKLEHAGEPRDGLEVLVQPVRQLAASHAARSEIQDETFLILDPMLQFPSHSGLGRFRALR